MCALRVQMVAEEVKFINHSQKRCVIFRDIPKKTPDLTVNILFIIRSFTTCRRQINVKISDFLHFLGKKPSFFCSTNNTNLWAIWIHQSSWNGNSLRNDSFGSGSGDGRDHQVDENNNKNNGQMPIAYQIHIYFHFGCRSANLLLLWLFWIWVWHESLLILL